MGFPKERYQAGQVLLPINQYQAQDLTGAAATVVGTFVIPRWWGGAVVKAMGFHAAAAGGAQVTAGTMGLYINAAICQTGDATPANLVAASVASHAIYSCVEQSLDKAPGAPDATAPSTIVPAPIYPKIAPGDTVQLKIVTQGSGSDQTVFPYLIISQDTESVLAEVHP